MKLKLHRDFYLENTYQVMTEEYLLQRGYCCHSGCRHCPYNEKALALRAQNQPRVVSFVPSLTETLIAAGANVVGTTRYCLHPQELVAHTTRLGGTKDLKADLLSELSPDFVIMDKEENKKEMANQVRAQLLTTHIRSLEDLKFELEKLGHTLHLKKLIDQSQRLDKIFHNPHLKKEVLKRPIENLPGLIDWWRQPQTPELSLKDYIFVYVIWRKPYMCVSQKTFVGSVFKTLGLSLWSPESATLYPEIELDKLPHQKNIVILFSSEPYPFVRYKNKFLDKYKNLFAALVDGEKFSWFGLRSLRFLEDELLTPLLTLPE